MHKIRSGKEKDGSYHAWLISSQTYNVENIRSTYTHALNQKIQKTLS